MSETASVDPSTTRLGVECSPTRTTPDSAAAPPGVARGVEHYVGARVAGLQNALLDRSHRSHSATVATLARLRRTQPGDVSDSASWDVVFNGMSPELVGRGDNPSPAERAIHAALLLYAGHAQSADGPRHIRGRRLGHAIGDLARADSPEAYAEGAVARRFRAFASATTWVSAVRHLRGLISLMRSHGIGLDYGALAADLYRIQHPEGLRRVRLQWARDFHHIPARPATDSPPIDSTEQEN